MDYLMFGLRIFGVLIAFVMTTILLLALHWLYCRLKAHRCPRCSSKWRTELVGEWDGEDWWCHYCHHGWAVYNDCKSN